MDTNGNMNASNTLCVLGDSDFEIAEGQPDIRGWSVKDQSGRRIGDADELIFDPNARSVRYIVVDLEGNHLGLDERKVLVPIGLVALHENEDEIILPSNLSASLSSLPDFDEDTISREYELNVREVFSGSSSTPGVAASSDAAEGDFYSHSHFDLTNMSKERGSHFSRTHSATVRDDNSRDEDLEALNDLIEINNDRIAGYRTAIEEAKEDDSDLKALFAQMINESSQYVKELSDKVRSLNGAREEGTTASGKLYRIWMDMKATFSGHDRKAVLENCEFGEDAAQKAYTMALEDDDLSIDVRQLLERQKSQLRVSHDKIKALRDGA